MSRLTKEMCHGWSMKFSNNFANFEQNGPTSEGVQIVFLRRLSHFLHAYTNDEFLVPGTML
jgi:hypothetical protein